MNRSNALRSSGARETLRVAWTRVQEPWGPGYRHYRASCRGGHHAVLRRLVPGAQPGVRAPAVVAPTSRRVARGRRSTSAGRSLRRRQRDGGEPDAVHALPACVTRNAIAGVEVQRRAVVRDLEVAVVSASGAQPAANT